MEADTIKQMEMKEKNLKRVSQANEESTGNQTLLQKSHQSYKRLGCLPCKTIGTILEVDISHKKTLTWLRKGNLLRETESFLIVAQDHAAKTNSVKENIDKMQKIAD